MFFSRRETLRSFLFSIEDFQHIKRTGTAVAPIATLAMPLPDVSTNPITRFGAGKNPSEEFARPLF
jgi:hypothetical protein